MTTGRLGSLLVLLAAPLLLAAYTGCNQFYGLDETRLPVDNKLTCDCECTPVAPDPVVSLAVVAFTDDAEQEGASMLLDSATLDLGPNQVGLRFANLKIPHRANIQTATVRFTASADDGGTANFKIFAEQSVMPATFSNADNDLTGRTFGAALDWTNVPAWVDGQTTIAQETPELKDVLQALVDDPAWTDASSFALRIEGVNGQRRAISRQTATSRAALLEVRYTTAVTASLPVCASEGVERSGNQITAQGLLDECARVERTLEGLAAPCGYPPDCSCVPDVDEGSSDSAVCTEPCDQVVVDATCSNFDPNAFERCIQGDSIANCKHFVAATNATGDPPVCVPSGSALAFHAFGSRSRCEVTGTSHIEIGDEEPDHDPVTSGVVELLARPCPGGGCRVHPYFDLFMEPITFEVKWHSDPVFVDLSATGRGLEPAVYGGGEIVYAPNGVAGTGNGRRLIDAVTHNSALALDGKNSAPLDIGIDWNTRECDMVGSIAGAIGDDGLCAGDGATSCHTDSPDCDEVGGPCVPPPGTEPMTVTVALVGGDLVNQPPIADAGPDQNVECTSTDGASFTLDGRGSNDHDRNMALASWREGSRVGPLVVNGLNAELALALGESRSYVLRVLDAYAQTDEDTTEVSVVDTTPPDIVCNAPATMPPPNHPVSFTATATDTCTDAVVPTLVGFECYKLNSRGERIDKTKTCKVVLSGATITISPPQGVGQHIVWTARATDGSGNVGEVACEIEVVQQN